MGDLMLYSHSTPRLLRYTHYVTASLLMASAPFRRYIYGISEETELKMKKTLRCIAKDGFGNTVRPCTPDEDMEGYLYNTGN